MILFGSDLRLEVLFHYGSLGGLRMLLYSAGPIILFGSDLRLEVLFHYGSLGGLRMLQCRTCA
jgi:hypothetical protein